MPQLTPEAAIARIADWDGLDVSCEVLGGGITNHNYLLSVTGRPDIPWGGKYVMRIPGDGTETFIDREREHKNHVAAAEAGVTPPVLYTLEPEKCTIVPFIEGETMHPETLAGDRDRLGKVVDVIRGLRQRGLVRSIPESREFIRNIKLRFYKTQITRCEVGPGLQIHYFCFGLVLVVMGLLLRRTE